jgi:hypothetical protein
MIKHRLCPIAVAAVLSLGAATAAAAGGCCPDPAVDCVCDEVVVAPMAIGLKGPIYVVNFGPVASGPGPMVWQPADKAPKPYPGNYPYVGFVFSGYPYGYYDAWVGAPAAYPAYGYPVRYGKRVRVFK